VHRALSARVQGLFNAAAAVPQFAEITVRCLEFSQVGRGFDQVGVKALDRWLREPGGAGLVGKIGERRVRVLRQSE